MISPEEGRVGEYGGGGEQSALPLLDQRVMNFNASFTRGSAG